MRPRLLFLCQTFPYPPDGGVWIRTYHVLRLLARAFDITALCFERAVGPDDLRAAAAGHEPLDRFGAIEVFSLPQRHSRWRYAWDHLRSAVRRRAYTAYLYESTAFRRRLAGICLCSATCPSSACITTWSPIFSGGAVPSSGAAGAGRTSATRRG